MSYYFTSESVSEGHPDKVADQISDALLDEFLRQDPESKVAVETMVTTGLVMLAGEVRTTGYVDVQTVAREVIRRIGYTKSEYQFEYNSCGVMSAIHEQSPDIFQGVQREKPEDQGAGDQGMMFGYATRETERFMPITLELSHRILFELSAIRKEGLEMTYLRPDAKSQVTLEYHDDHTPKRIDTIVVSTQHDEDVSLEKIREDVVKILLPRVARGVHGLMKELLDEYLAVSPDPSGQAGIRSTEAGIRFPVSGNIDEGVKLFVNPTGKFVIGGPHGDTGLTGRKIVVDTYGGKAPHGGGAFSGKDPSKVDRSAAYAARHIAKNLVAAGVADEVEVQLAYAIGVAEPVSVFVNTFGSAKNGSKSRKVERPKGQYSDSDSEPRVEPGVTSGPFSDEEIARKVKEIFDLRPYAIVERFGLKNPIYLPTASYGHFGREPYEKDGMVFFGWERLDYVDRIREVFGL